MLVPERFISCADYTAMSRQAWDMLMDVIEGRRRDTANLAARMQPRQYGDFLTEKRDRIRQMVQTGSRRLDVILAEKEGRMAGLQAALQALNPAALVRRGYGQLEQQGRIVADIRRLDKECPLRIQLVDGAITTEIKEVDIYGKNDG